MGNIIQGRNTLPLPKTFTAVLAILLLYILPTFVACSKWEEENTETDQDSQEIVVRLKSEGMSGMIQVLDVFVFNDDEHRKLEVYNRIEYHEDDFIVACSRTGKKIIVVLANSSKDKYEWSQIDSWKSMEKLMLSLEEEQLEYPTLTGIMQVDNHPVEIYELSLHPLLSKIHLNSLEFDFDPARYKGQTLSEIKCYLTNVCDLYPLIHSGGYTSQSFINNTRLSEKDLEKMKEPDMIYKSWENERETETFEHSFYCYPNIKESTRLLQPYTRLVIEGKLEGITYYYPINLKFWGWVETEGKWQHALGIMEGKEYDLSIVISRPGVLDPDLPISFKDVRIQMTVQDWMTKKKEIIEY